jgi:hypothetical protein
MWPLQAPFRVGQDHAVHIPSLGVLITTLLTAFLDLYTSSLETKQQVPQKTPEGHKMNFFYHVNLKPYFTLNSPAGYEHLSK